MTDSFDTISSEEPGRAAAPAREPGRAGAGAKATALSAALTLVIAGGVATAAYRSSTDSTGPASLVPANAFAIASVDLGLSGGQDDALDAFLDHFPGSPTRSGSGSTRDRLLRAFLSSIDGPVDYDEDVKPWLGDHAAIAGWLDDGKPQMELLLQSNDDDSARAHLNKVFNGDPLVVMSHGYAVVGDSQAQAKAAIDAAEKSSLADDADYSGDVGGLPDNEILTAWVDGPSVADLLEQSFMTSPGMGPMFGMLGLGGLQQALSGRFALGVRADDDFAQLDLRQIGGPQSTTAGSSLLTDLPAGTVGAIEFGDPGKVLGAAMGLVQTFGAFGSSSSVGSSCIVDVLPPPPGAVPAQPRKARRHEVPPDFTCPEEPTEPPLSPLEALKQATGLTFPDDAKTILGDGAVVAYGGIHFGGLPDVAIRSHPTDLSTAQSLAQTLQSHLADDPGIDIAVQPQDSDLILATSETYAAEIAKDGALGEQDQFGVALGDVPDAVTMAGYVDFSRIWPLLGDHIPTALTHLKALGFWGDRDGDVQHLQLRVVAG